MFRPKIREQFDIFPTGSDSYQVRGPEYLSVLKGGTVKQVFGHLLPLLDGEHTTDQLIDKLDGIAPPEIIKALLLKLEDSGVLEEAPVDDYPELPPEHARAYRNQVLFFKIAGQAKDGAKNQKALLESTVSVVGAGGLASRIVTECEQAGVGTVVGLNLSGELPAGRDGSASAIKTPGLDPEDVDSIERLVAADPPSLLVLALDRPQPTVLDKINQLSQDLNIPLLHSRIDIKEGIVGPLVAPGKTACLKCHHLRVIRNYNFYDEHLQWEKWIDGKGKRERAASPSLSPLTGIVAGMAALEIVKKLSSFYEPELYGKFLTINALTLEVIPHQVLRIPRCPSCGKLRDKVSTTPWIKDERNNSQGRVSYKPQGNAGENGGHS